MLHTFLHPEQQADNIARKPFNKGYAWVVTLARFRD